MTLITDPTEAYFKDGQWTWDGTQWRKQPLLFGYSDVYDERISNINVPAGTVTQTFSAVPAGEVWVVTLFTAFPSQGNTTRVLMKMEGTSTHNLHVVPTPPGSTSVYVPVTPIILAATYYLEIVWENAALNDDFRASAMGYKMSILE